MDIAFVKLSRHNKILEQRYKQALVERIRQKYSLDDELAVLRQRDTKPEEFAAYNDYIESCKAALKAELGL